MDRRIEEAIRLRIGLIDYLRAAKKIDSTICNVEITRDSSDVGNKQNLFPIWKEWQELADAFQTAKEAIPDCDTKKKLPALVKKTQSKLEDLLESTIIEVIAEIIICDFNVDAISIFKGGFRLYSSSNPSYRSNYEERYKMPESILDILDTHDESSVLTYELIEEVMIVFKYENMGMYGTEYLECRHENGMPLILIGIVKE